ncbi:MAG: queuosine precursor transporter [Tatlockia sp.]|nr:queuosine precursor transporter [Tatlockia sp.]
MKNLVLDKKEVRAYIFLTSIVICGLAGSLITAPKIVHFGINFPFSNIVFSLLTYPIVDCVCELWGKKIARQTIWIGLGSQLLLTLIIQISIIAPYSSFWYLQSEYQLILSTGFRVVIASLIAFAISQILDISVYQKLKEISKGKKLLIRANLATYLGQTIDSILFVNIVFYNSNQKTNILLGSILIKIFLSFLMTPVVYLIIYMLNKYLELNTLAFKIENLSEQRA